MRLQPDGKLTEGLMQLSRYREFRWDAKMLVSDAFPT
jgi:hypothetical protein